MSLRISHVFGVSAVAVLHGRQFPETVQRPIPCTTPPVLQAVQFPRWFAVLDTLTTCPLLVTTGVWSWTVSYCRVSAVAVLWWSVPSPSLQVQVPMVLTVQLNNVADVLVMLLCWSHRFRLCFVVFPPVPGAGPFLSCSTSSSTLFGSGGSSRTTRIPDVSA